MLRPPQLSTLFPYTTLFRSLMVMMMTRFFGKNRSWKEGLSIIPLTLFGGLAFTVPYAVTGQRDRKSTRLNSSHVAISYAAVGLKKKKNKNMITHLSEITPLI